MNIEAYSGTQAIHRAVAVLRAFGPEPSGLTPQQISQRTGLNRSTVYRLLSALEREGLVAGDRNGRYRLGADLIALANLALHQIDLREIALPHLRDLARQSGETVDLEVLRGELVLIIEEVAGDHRLTVTGNIGRTYPAWRTSTGKALLALLAPDGAGLLPGQADRIAALEVELELIRQRGYATSYEELEAHLHAVGAPIFDHTGRAIAAVSVSGPAARLPRTREPEIAALVINTTLAISRELGYRDML